MIKGIIKPYGTLPGMNVFRQANVLIDEEVRLQVRWAHVRTSLEITDPDGAVLARSQVRTQFVPPRRFHDLIFTNDAPGIPKTTLFWKWFSPHLLIGEQEYKPQMWRVDDDPIIAFDAKNWGFHCVDYETAIHFHTADPLLLIPVVFVTYFVWTCRNMGRR